VRLARLFVIPVLAKDDDVNVTNLHPKMLYALGWVARIFKNFGASEVVITSGNDHLHLHGGGDLSRTLHDDNRAVDLRTWAFGGDVELVAQALRMALGAEFDVVVESTHLHLELDPF
jgi:tRNA C32,U32 (ribose-2'-O)-methylase TrmJ